MRDSCSAYLKMRDRVLPVSKSNSRVSNSARETCVWRLTQPTLKVRVLTPREVRGSTKNRRTRFQNSMSSKHKVQKSPHAMGLSLVPQMSHNGPEELPDKEKECPPNHSLMLL